MGSLKNIFWIVAFAGLVLLPISAAAGDIDNELSLWPSVHLNLPVSEKVSIQTLVQPRLGSNLSRLEQVFLEGLVHYQVGKNFKAGVGYNYVALFDPHRHENRVFGEVVSQHFWKGLRIDNRLRAETLFRDGMSRPVVRGRYLIGFKRHFPNSKLYWLLSDELFINLNSSKGGLQQGVDQNRVFVGVGQKVHKHAALEGGYQWIVLNRPRPANEFFNHTIVLRLVIQ